MLKKHVAFEEAVLVAQIPDPSPSDERARIERLTSKHRRQRAELSVLATLAFQDTADPGVNHAFRGLISDLIADMDVEERELVARRAQTIYTTVDESESDGC